MIKWNEITPKLNVKKIDDSILALNDLNNNVNKLKSLGFEVEIKIITPKTYSSSLLLSPE